MQRNDWQKVKTLLSQVRELDAEERRSALDSLCTDRALRSEVDSLLAAEADEFLSISASQLTHDFFAGNDPLIGERIGVYRVVKEIGSGGMGTVYLAERDDQKFESIVAIKVLRRELISDEVRRGFDREKTILAKLVHPYISRLLDAGTGRDGSPYLIMEYVDGVPIDAFCRQNSLSVVQKLKLFNKICEAVAFAHRSLVIHGDIKPGNVLITASGEPKLLDFGIAAISDEIGESNIFTAPKYALTPAYASPEQVMGDRLTTATDVYSLGIVLRKILMGSLPADGQDTAAEIAGGDSDRYKDDVMAIVDRATALTPDERYQTVEKLRDDIWRTIDDHPVEARTPSFAYRFSKLYRRNKVAITAAAIVLLAVVAGIVVSTWKTVEATEARNVAVRESQLARSEQAKSEKISQFMARLIAYANSRWYAEGSKYKGDARVVDALLEMGDQIDPTFVDEPDVAAELHYKFGEALGGAKATDQQMQELIRSRMRSHHFRALELRVQAHGEFHSLVAKDLFYVSEMLGSDRAEQARLLDRALNMMRQTDPTNRNFPFIIEAYVARMVLPTYEPTHDIYRRHVTPQTSESSLEIAERYLEEGLPYIRLHFGADSMAVVSPECRLSYVLAREAKWDKFDLHFAICTEGLERFPAAEGRRTELLAGISEAIRSREGQ